MWDLWWTKRRWGRFHLSTSVSPAKPSTNCSTPIIIRGWYNRPVMASEIMDSVPLHLKRKKTLIVYLKHSLGHNLKLGHDYFLPDPSNFIILLNNLQFTIYYNLRYEHILTWTKKKYVNIHLAIHSSNFTFILLMDLGVKLIICTKCSQVTCLL
jgi:hypothetical protein